MKVFETSMGRVAFINSDDYFTSGLLRGSMGAVQKKTVASMTVLLGDAVNADTMTAEYAEKLALELHGKLMQ